MGGKAAGLALLVRQGLPVPPFFVVLPEEDLAGLDAALADLGPGPYAVRSSALAEDGARHSFAGQLQSVLGAASAEEVRAAIATCRASGGSERVMAYGAARGIEPGPVAVVVQRMILGQASGVMSTRDPGLPEHCLISAAFGLCRGVVQGGADCDTFLIDTQGEFTAQIEEKRIQVELVEGAPAEVLVPEAQRTAPVLSEAQARQLCAWGRAMERLEGRPQSMEWTLEGDRLWLLQARPISAPVPAGRRLLWDDDAVVGSCSGVTTPLTWSLARSAQRTFCRLFCRVMQVPAAAVAEHDPVFRRMFGLIRGRIFRNLDASQRVLTLLPGFLRRRAAVVQLLGVSEMAADEDALVAASAWQRVVQGPRLASSLAWRLLWLRRDLRRFKRDFTELHGRWRARELDTLSPEELLAAHHELQRGVPARWTAPLVNEIFTRVLYGALCDMCTRDLCGGDARAGAQYANALLAAQGGLESTAPTIELLRRAARLRAAPWATELFDGPLSDGQILAEARREPSFSRWLDDWLRRWGDRCVGELKIEAEPLTARPERVVSALRGYLRGQPIDPDHLGEEARRHRERAEAEALRRLSGARRLLFRWVLGQARACVVARDHLRFLRARYMGLTRDLFRALGAQLAAAGAIEAADDVVWLESEELFGWVEGTTTCTDLAGLVALRRAEFARFAAEPAPSGRFLTWGPVHRANRFAGRRARPHLPADGLLRGAPCYPGLVVGPAVVLTDPTQGVDLDGAILVACHMDPGWVPLFPSVSGLLVERGSPLSHAAVTARELGIPTIFGVRDLCALVKGGQRLRMDGGAGTVKILGRPEEAG